MDIKAQLQREICQFVEKHSGNVGEEGGRYFDAPLVGFASAADSLFEDYKRIIGPFHWTPAEILNQGAPTAGPMEGTVVSWVLPITEPVRMSNRMEDRYPSRQWGHTRNFGELFNDEVRKMVVVFLTKQGGQAAAPMLMEGWKRVDDVKAGLASTWSERHAAYAAGLGTFSINDGLITSRGIAHRCGSVITDIVMEPTARPYVDHRENCLLCRGEECGICIQRCPAGAISGDGHDKDLCNRYTYGGQFKSLAKKYGAKEIGCGLCQTDVPCESQVPSLNCPFCSLTPDRVISESEYSITIRDAFPVSEGHSLIIPRRHVQSFFELRPVEKEAILQALEEAKEALDAKHSPKGYNIGINDGEAAGQTVPHMHVHLIPRYKGDSKDPRGGVRWVIPEKAKYWEKG